jgi:AraC-like DNA-binding protein
MSDPLAALVGLLRPRALTWKRAVGQEAWSWRMPADEGVVFGRVLQGSCRYDVPGVGSGVLNSGDTFLVVAPPQWALTSLEASYRATDFDDLPSDVVSIGVDPSLAEGGVRFIGGHFAFDSINTHLLIPYLTRIIHISRNPGGGRGALDALLELFDSESVEPRPGQEIVLSRLLEILLVELLRTQGEPSVHRLGMMFGLADPQIGRALRAFHADIHHKWSVETLAETAVMSRTAFADRFGRLVGTSPMQYVTQWRMAVARDALRDGAQSIDEIAAATGYGSRSAFSTAFSRVVGASPGQFADTARQLRERS